MSGRNRNSRTAKKSAGGKKRDVVREEEEEAYGDAVMELEELLRRERQKAPSSLPQTQDHRRSKRKDDLEAPQAPEKQRKRDKEETTDFAPKPASDLRKRRDERN